MILKEFEIVGITQKERASQIAQVRKKRTIEKKSLLW